MCMHCEIWDSGAPQEIWDLFKMSTMLTITSCGEMSLSELDRAIAAVGGPVLATMMTVKGLAEDGHVTIHYNEDELTFEQLNRVIKEAVTTAEGGEPMKTHAGDVFLRLSADGQRWVAEKRVAEPQHDHFIKLIQSVNPAGDQPQEGGD